MIGQSTLEEIMPGLTFRRLADGQIHEYSVSQMTPALVDAWAAKVKSEIEPLPQDTTLFALYDLSGFKKVTLPSYLREKMKDMAMEFENKGIHHASIQAIILPRNFMTHFVRIFLNSMPNSGLTITHVFFTRAEGIMWLEAKLKQYISEQHV